MPAFVLSAQPRPSSESGVYPVADAPRAKSLRAGEPASRMLSPQRAWARAIERPIIERVMRPLANVDIASTVGSGGDARGSQVRAGSVPLTAGELAMLFEPAVGALALVQIVREAVRYRLQQSATELPTRVRLKTLLALLDSAEELLSA